MDETESQILSCLRIWAPRRMAEGDFKEELETYSRYEAFIARSDYFHSIGNLERLAPDRKAWVQCPMPPNTFRVHTEYLLVKSVDPKVLWAESRVQGIEE
ncbi:hypothetical protein TNCV_4474951 [Trichonephila clavipes]|nr:hypothetical protein TNCV_4474951 [Trichonephila clavipes]